MVFELARVLESTALLDLHCHILPGVDDGAPDLDEALAMARVLADAGFRGVAASPHLGEGPGGDVPLERAAAARAELEHALTCAGISLTLYANAEHHVTPDLYARQREGGVVSVGGMSHWLLVELPWQAIPNIEDALFRLQAGGHRLLLAHPERYRYLKIDTIERLVARGVRMQLEIGSFASLYGRSAHVMAVDVADRGLGHVLATDMHRSQDSAAWLHQGLLAAANRYGQQAVSRGASAAPEAILKDLPADQITAFSEGR